MFDPETKIKASKPKGLFILLEKVDGRRLIRCGICYVGFAGNPAKTIKGARKHAHTHHKQKIHE